MTDSQLQEFLDHTGYLDPFQSSFQCEFGMETALVDLFDDLRRDLDGGNASLLILFNFSMAFVTIDHGVLLGVDGVFLLSVLVASSGSSVVATRRSGRR